jgi:hypothetical protein
MCNSRRETVFPKLVEDTKRGVFLNEANQRLRPMSHRKRAAESVSEVSEEKKPRVEQG